MINLNVKPLERMSVSEKIGQLVMGGFLTSEYDDDIKELVEKYKLGNIILFTRNYENPKQMKELCFKLHKNIVKICGTFPLISIDQEGGTVTRMMNDVTFAPSAMSCGASSVDYDAALEAGRAIGRDMIKLGMNINLAPVLEINKGCTNYSMNVRSYGSNPRTISKHVASFKKGLSEYGVLSTLKHFPGSGDTKQDSHLELPVIETTIEEMHENSLYPFIKNIDADAVMTSHCLFKAYDKIPATLSKRCVNGLLREELGFKGIIFTDGLEMKAISDYYTIGEAGLMAINAGVDILLVCHEKSQIIEVIERLKQAYKNGELTDEVLDDHVRRICEYKKKTLPYLEKYFNNDECFVEDIEASNKMQEIVDKSITLLKGEKPHITKDTLIISPVATVSSIVEDVFDNRDLTLSLKKYFDNTIYRYEPTQEFKEKIIEDGNKYENIIVISYDPYKEKTQISFINELIAKYHNKVYVITLKGPVEDDLFIGLNNYMCMYEYTPNSIRSVVKYFCGKIPVVGKLPLE